MSWCRVNRLSRASCTSYQRSDRSRDLHEPRFCSFRRGPYGPKKALRPLFTWSYSLSAPSCRSHSPCRSSPRRRRCCTSPGRSACRLRTVAELPPDVAPLATLAKLPLYRWGEPHPMSCTKVRSRVRYCLIWTSAPHRDNGSTHADLFSLVSYRALHCLWPSDRDAA